MNSAGVSGNTRMIRQAVSTTGTRESQKTDPAGKKDEKKDFSNLLEEIGGKDKEGQAQEALGHSDVVSDAMTQMASLAEVQVPAESVTPVIVMSEGVPVIAGLEEAVFPPASNSAGQSSEEALMPEEPGIQGQAEQESSRTENMIQAFGREAGQKIAPPKGDLPPAAAPNPGGDGMAKGTAQEPSQTAAAAETAGQTAAKSPGEAGKTAAGSTPGAAADGTVSSAAAADTAKAGTAQGESGQSDAPTSGQPKDTQLSDRLKDAQMAATGQTPAEQVNSNEVIRVKVAEPYDGANEAFAKRMAQIMESRLPQGSGQYEIQLEPESLGKIAIRIAMTDLGAKVELHCENARTLGLLMENAKEIGSIVAQNTGQTVQVTVHHQDPDYLNQQGQNGQQAAEEEAKQRQQEQQQRKEPQEQTDFVQRLRLGLFQNMDQEIA